MGIGDWGLGIGDWAQSPEINPMPNPQDVYKYFKYLIPLSISYFI